ncbi:MAG: hypothetical protein KDB00_04880 [Planctomycetales bacterium]|nr:hypothetical protein [Planctomycetales bacterium]
MKHILAALLALGFVKSALAGPIDAGSYNAKHDYAGHSILVSESVDDVSAAKQIMLTESEPAIPDSRPASVHMTRALAPTVDGSQPPTALPPPIVAGTIPEDKTVEEQRQVHPTPATRDQGKKKQSLFDKLFKRSFIK